MVDTVLLRVLLTPSWSPPWQGGGRSPPRWWTETEEVSEISPLARVSTFMLTTTKLDINVKIVLPFNLNFKLSKGERLSGKDAVTGFSRSIIDETEAATVFL